MSPKTKKEQVDPHGMFKIEDCLLEIENCLIEIKDWG
jgi:hypothetical protein